MRDMTSEMYREFTGWAPWVYVLIWGAMVGSALPLVFGVDGADEWAPLARWGTAGLIAGSAYLIQLLFGGLLVTVHRDGVKVGLGRARILGTFIPFTEVEDTEVVTYKPLREFGGWGLRGTRKKRAWSARGDRAVVLHTTDDRRIYIGSEKPERLEARIRGAMGMMPGGTSASHR